MSGFCETLHGARLSRKPDHPGFANNFVNLWQRATDQLCCIIDKSLVRGEPLRTVRLEKHQDQMRRRARLTNYFVLLHAVQLLFDVFLSRPRMSRLLVNGVSDFKRNGILENFTVGGYSDSQTSSGKASTRSSKLSIAFICNQAFDLALEWSELQ